MKLVAAQMKVKLPADVAVVPEVDLGMTNGGYLLQARLNVSLPGIESDIAQKIVNGAHQSPYSKATRGNINVVISVKTDPVARGISWRLQSVSARSPLDQLRPKTSKSICGRRLY